MSRDGEESGYDGDNGAGDIVSTNEEDEVGDTYYREVPRNAMEEDPGYMPDMAPMQITSSAESVFPASKTSSSETQAIQSPRIEQKHSIRGNRSSPRPSSNKKKKGMAFPLFVLAGCLALSYMIPKALEKFGVSFNGNGMGSGDMLTPRMKHYPTCREGAVIITDAAYGHARQTALLLADQGLHVLAGVRTKAEELSFTYDARKGLEPFLMDVSEPNDVAKLYYRLKFVLAELHRPLYGVLINTADMVLDKDFISTQKSKDQTGRREDDHFISTSFNSTHMRHVSQHVIDVPSLDDGYNLYVKGPLRVVQGALEVLAEAHEKYEMAKAIAASVDVDGVSAKSRQSGAGYGHCEEGQAECEASNVSGVDDKKEQNTKGKDKDKKRRDQKRERAHQRVLDQQLCSAGVTGRILFMSFDMDTLAPPAPLVHTPPAKVGANTASGESKKGGLLSRILPRLAPKPKRPLKIKERNTTTASNTNTTADSASSKSKDKDKNKNAKSDQPCGAPCALHAALKTYADQLETSLWDSDVLVSRMAVSSQPYRSTEEHRRGSKAGSRRAKTSTLSEQAEEISRIERQWVELNVEADSDKDRNRYKDGEKDSGGAKSRQGKKKLPHKSSIIIDAKYSLEANQAAHAFLSSQPLQWYDQHRIPPKKPRQKFLGL